MCSSNSRSFSGSNTCTAAIIIQRQRQPQQHLCSSMRSAYVSTSASSFQQLGRSLGDRHDIYIGEVMPASSATSATTASPTSAHRSLIDFILIHSNCSLNFNVNSTELRVSFARAAFRFSFSYRQQLHVASSSMLQREKQPRCICPHQQESSKTVRMRTDAAILSFSDNSSAVFAAYSAFMNFGDSARAAYVVRIINCVNFSSQLSVLIATTTMA
jgi:hypothetical protein